MTNPNPERTPPTGRHGAHGATSITGNQQGSGPLDRDGDGRVDRDDLRRTPVDADSTAGRNTPPGTATPAGAGVFGTAADDRTDTRVSERVARPAHEHGPGQDHGHDHTPGQDHGHEHPAHDRDRDHDRQPGRDRDHDGRDDVTGAAIPQTAKEMTRRQRDRFGGIHWGSGFFGWVSATGIAVILLALLSAAGLVFGLSTDVTAGTVDQNSTGIGLGAAIALLVVLFLAYLAGGYVAGRMARFNGTKQGLAVWVWGVLVTVALAVVGLVAGSQYNVLSDLNLPAIPIDSGSATTAGLIALAAVLVVTLVGALLGGKLGSRYHRKVDRAGYEPV